MKFPPKPKIAADKGGQIEPELKIDFKRRSTR